MKQQKEKVLALVLFLVALLPRLALIWQNQFDGLYGQDAYAYFDYARTFLSSLAQGSAPPPFWWPLDYPSLLALAFLIGGSTAFAAQTLTVLTGALTVPLTFFLTRELATDKKNLAGLVAALGVALSGQSLQSSIVIMADVPALFWATLAAFALLRHLRANQTRWLILSSAALALATMTRWIFGALALVWGIIVLWNFWQLRDTRRFVFVTCVAGVSGLVVLAPQIVATMFNPSPFFGHSWLVGWNPVNALNRAFDNVDGHFDYALPVGIFYAQPAFHPAYLSPPLTVFFVIGAFVVARAARIFPTRAILLFGWIVTQYVFLAGIPYENFRFGLSYLVPLAVLVGVGFVRALDSSARVFSFRARWVFAALLLGGLVFNLIWLARPSQVIFDIKRVELELAHAVSARVASNATILTFGPTLALQHYTALNVVELSTETRASLNERVQHDTAVYLLVNVENLASQWQGLVPETNFQFLKNEYNVAPLFELDSYTLFQIQKP